MAKGHKQAKPTVRQEMSGVERLGLRVSSMINHPVAQAQRWVTIHRLDTDGDREWEEVLGVIAETDELELTLNDGMRPANPPSCPRRQRRWCPPNLSGHPF